MKKLPSPKKIAYCLTALLTAILLLSGFSILRHSLFHNGSPQGMTAEIYKNGELLQTVSLSQVTREYTITVPGENGAYNIIWIGPEGIRVSEASCPEKLCVRQGLLSDSLLPVICLPNRLVIRLVSQENDESSKGADAVTY